MFEAITKAITEAQERDEEKIQRRKSKRVSARHTLTEDSNARIRNLIELEEENSSDADKPFEKEEVQSPSMESDIEEDEDDLIEDRAKWDTDYIVIVHMIAFAVGGSNVWRFGFLCYSHGGIAFMIPYLIFMLVCALPCVYLEILVGQYSQVGSIAAWKLVPLFKGVGMCMTLLGFLVILNIQSITAWCLFYMFQAVFHRPLPWISCDNGFGKLQNGQTDDTVQKWFPQEPGEDEGKNWHTENCTEFYGDSGTGANGGSFSENLRLPGSEYFRGRVQRMWKSGFADRQDSNYMEDNGKVVFGLDSRDQGILEHNLDTLIALVATFIIIELCIARGIKTHAKTMVVLTLTPYVLLALLLFRATGLSGAWGGLEELFRPDISKLWDTDTWWKAAEQVFFSVGVGFGVHLTCASHNHFNRRIVYDAAITVAVDAITSIVAAATIFMYMGHVKFAVNRELEVFVRAGPELIFEVMSDVLGVLAKANFYAFAFYLFIFLLALTTITTTLIFVKTSYLEVLPVTIKYKTGVRLMLMALLYSISFIISSLNLTRGGLHTYNFLNTFSGLYTIVLAAFLFVIGIAWFFGLREIVEATAAMDIRAPGIYFQVSWKFISPIVLGIVFFGLIFDAGSHELKFDGNVVPVSLGVYAVGYILALGPILAVIGGAAHALWMAPGKNFKEKLLTSISPTKEHKDILATGTGKRAKLSHYFYLYAPTPGAKCNICCSLMRHKHENKVAPEPHINDTVAKDANVDNSQDKSNNDLSETSIPSVQISVEEVNVDNELKKQEIDGGKSPTEADNLPQVTDTRPEAQHHHHTKQHHTKKEHEPEAKGCSVQ